VKYFSIILLLLLAYAPCVSAQDDGLADYAAFAERYAQASHAAADAGAESDPVHGELLARALEFREFLTNWLLDSELEPDVATSVRDDRFILTQHIVQILSGLSRCDEADTESDGLLSTEYYALAAASVETCRDQVWSSRYNELAARRGERGAAHQLVQHVLDGQAAGVVASTSAPDVGPAIEVAADEWASAGECEVLSDWLRSLQRVPPGATQIAHRCAVERWTAQVQSARSRFAESRLSWRTEGGDSNAQALQVIEAADALTTLVLVGLDEGFTDVDTATTELFETATIAVTASSDAQHCEAGRAVIGTVERIERVHGPTPDQVYRSALTHFQEDCRPPRDRVRAAGVGLSLAGGTVLAAGIAWDMAVMLGPESERRSLQGDCVGTTLCEHDQEIFDLSERVSRSQLPVLVLYSIGATSLLTGATVLFVKERRSRRRADAVVWNVVPGWGSATMVLQF
jgi:hypothetical protein